MTNRDAWLAEGTESYRIFIRSLLSITDNLVNDKVVHPDERRHPRRRRPLFRRRRRQGHRDLLRRRQRDRARAQFLARRRLRQRRLATATTTRRWGSPPRARGSPSSATSSKWASTCSPTRSRVAGCGDMSGDVFGNGMLLSKTIKLVAAFDHRHIFIDPDPDPASELGRAQAAVRPAAVELGRLRPQADLARAAASSRAREKSIPLSAEAREALGIDARRARPGDADQRDPQEPGRPDVVRRHRHLHQGVDAESGRRRRSRQRRAARRARSRSAPRSSAKAPTSASPRPGGIEFAEHGGRINTDFIDNSAGVDCSDNEVNIKIPLNREMREGRLSFEQAQRAAGEDDRRGRRARARGQPAADAGAVDRRSRRRAGASRAMSGRSSCSKRRAGSTARSRAWQSSEELLRRGQENRGLTRPELAVVLSMSKLVLQDAAEELQLADDKLVEPQLFDAFPKPMRKAHADAIRAHRLRNEIIAHQGRQPPRQPPRPGRRLRPDRGGRRLARSRSIVGLPRRRAPARPRQAVARDRGRRRCPKRCASSCSRSPPRASARICPTSSARPAARPSVEQLVQAARARRAQDFGGGDQADPLRGPQRGGGAPRPADRARRKRGHRPRAGPPVRARRRVRHRRAGRRARSSTSLR